VVDTDLGKDTAPQSLHATTAQWRKEKKMRRHIYSEHGKSFLFPFAPICQLFLVLILFTVTMILNNVAI
jgi:hypothetical protein